MTDSTDNNTTPAAEKQTEPTPSAPDKPSAAEMGDGGKSALVKEREARRDAERKAAEAEQEASSLRAAELRRSVAASKGLTDTQARFLVGEDEESMAAHADELIEAFSPEPASESRRRPAERLRPGAAPSIEPVDITSVADSVMSGY